jgi:hypothetical protein
LRMFAPGGTLLPDVLRVMGDDRSGHE